MVPFPGNLENRCFLDTSVSPRKGIQSIISFGGIRLYTYMHIYECIHTYTVCIYLHTYICISVWVSIAFNSFTLKLSVKSITVQQFWLYCNESWNQSQQSPYKQQNGLEPTHPSIDNSSRIVVQVYQKKKKYQTQASSRYVQTCDEELCFVLFFKPTKHNRGV